MNPNDPSLTSFIPVQPDSHFPIQNLPYGIFRTKDNPTPRVGVAIGEHVLDLSVLASVQLLQDSKELFEQSSLNVFIEAGREVWRRTRLRISELLRSDMPTLRDDHGLRRKAFVQRDDAIMLMPVRVEGYTDFYSSKEHATNVGMMFRDPKNALLPNWLHIPIGYNGRASSVVVSGTPIRRPLGQLKGPNDEVPKFGPCKKLDFEFETAFIVGKPTELGAPIPVGNAEDHMFGMVLLNDWSARDIQQWEYVPLGPFNSKTFGTSISPWVVTMDALTPFRVAGPDQEPVPLAYLKNISNSALDLNLECAIIPGGEAASVTICRTNFKYMYWSMAQQLAHHTVSGCNVRVGDLMGSGTISGPTEGSYGSLLELTWNGQKPLLLNTGHNLGHDRSFLEDDDEVIMTGWCQGDGYRVGFGQVTGKVLKALAVE